MLAVTDSSTRTESPLAVDEPPVAALRNVSVRFGGVTAISDVSLTLAPNETVACIGPNGAGKSTILNVISALATPASGTREVAGHDTTRSSPVEVTRLGVGRSFQDPKLLEDSSLLENLLCGMHLSAGYSPLDQIVRPWVVRRRERRSLQRAEEVLSMIQLESNAHDSVSALPFGARKLADLGRALMGSPQLLLFDEPSSGLDHGEREVVQGLIEQIARESQTTILVVEHNMGVVRAIADKVIGMEGGSVLKVGTASEVLDSREFRTAIVGARRSAGDETTITGDDE